MYQEGDLINEFNLPGIDAQGKEQNFTLRDLLQKKYLILYFYPKDSTPGCTTQACDFRDNLNFLQEKAAVVGVSPDSLASHQRFKEKQALNFPLLSDPEKSLMQAFGAFGEKKNYGKVYQGVIRSTFIIDRQGKLIKALRNVKAKGHVERILGVIEGLD